MPVTSLRRAGLALAVTLLATGAARANSAPLWHPGDAAGEPPGRPPVAVVHETLTLDLRPFDAGEPAPVEAVYRLDNAGPELVLPVRFRSPRVGDPTVTLDGAPVPVTARVPLEPASAPTSAPASAPTTAPAEPPPALTRRVADGSGETRRIEPRGEDAVDFTLRLAPGPHTLTVAFRHTPLRDANAWGVWDDRVVQYDLAPARGWAAFGTLEVAATLPAGWLATSDPPLAREGDRLTGRFAGLPADWLILSTRRPGGFGDPWVRLFVPMGLVALAVTVAIVVIRRRRRLPLFWLWAPILGGVLFAGATLLGQHLMAGAADPVHALAVRPAAGYGAFFLGSTALFPLLVLWGLLGVLVRPRPLAR